MLVFDRARLQRIIFPFLKAALSKANCDIVILDDGSTDPEVSKWARALNPVDYIRSRKMVGWNQQYQIAAELAHQHGQEKVVVFDDDILPGVDAIAQMLDAHVSPQWPVACAFAKTKLTTAGRTELGYYVDPEPLGCNVLDCIVTLHVPSMDNGVLRRVGKNGAARELGSRPVLVRPQVAAQHLGYWAGCGKWHNPDNAGSWHVHRPCVDPLNGRPVEVPGFDRGLFEYNMLAGSLEAASKGLGSAPGKEGHTLVVRAANVNPLVLTAIHDSGPGKRVLVAWEGAWRGETTRRALGIDSQHRYVRVLPAGKVGKHMWYHRTFVALAFPHLRWTQRQNLSIKP